MPDVRSFEQAPATVTVGLTDGQSKTGTLSRFDPEAEDLSILSSVRNPDGSLDRIGVHVPVHRMSYVAFYRDTHVVRPPADTMGETRVYAPGGNTFSVWVRLDALDDRLGFYGFPVSRASLYSEVFFFAEGITAMEDATPLGELLVQQGLVDDEALREGCLAQAGDRESPIGQILVEQQVLAQAEVDQAAEAQGQKRHRAGKPMRLGEILVEAGLATAEQIEGALAEQRKRRGKRLGEVLVDLGIVREEVIARTLAAKFHVPYVDLDEYDVDPEAAGAIPSGIVERFGVLPVQADARTLTVAMSDPTAIEALDMLRFSLNRRLSEVVVRPSQLDRYIEPYLPRRDEEEELLDAALEELMEAPEPTFEESGEDVEALLREEGAITRLAYKLILAAHHRGASDIHVEPSGKEQPMTVRYRVDGECSVYRKLPAAFRANLVARLKIMAGLDITERRKPQDGKIRLRLKDRKLELRVATLPTAEGNEDVVMRLLAGSTAIPMNALGLSDANFAAARKVIAQPYGLILVVGPTGSGKTTTLHAMLGTINDERRKIWTAEDPVEITQAGLRQLQVNPRVGLDFATAMRAFLRADPDVIMVGEMRDHETASMGVEASLTGHLVMSTLHTNTAPETITRLVDMGLEPFTFSDALLGVLAQRLTRRLCPDCREAYEASAQELDQVLTAYGPLAREDGIVSQPLTLWQAPGCDACNGSGYRGRVGIHELMINDDAISRATQTGVPAAELRQLAIEGGMRTLLQDGVRKCLEGHTDMRQVLAVCSR